MFFETYPLNMTFGQFLRNISSFKSIFGYSTSRLLRNSMKTNQQWDYNGLFYKMFSIFVGVIYRVQQKMMHLNVLLQFWLYFYFWDVNNSISQNQQNVFFLCFIYFYYKNITFKHKKFILSLRNKCIEYFSQNIMYLQ